MLEESLIASTLRAKLSRKHKRGGLGHHGEKRFVPRPEGQDILRGTRLSKADKADRKYIEAEERFLARMRAITKGGLEE